MTIRPRQLPASIRACAWHVWRNYPPAKDWGRELLWRWMGWHSAQGTIGMVLDDDKSVIGVGIARPVMRPQDMTDPYELDPEGRCLAVDLATATKAGVLLTLFLLMLKRFGYRERIAFRRWPEKEIRDYSLMAFRDRMTTTKALIYG